MKFTEDMEDPPDLPLTLEDDHAEKREDTSVLGYYKKFRKYKHQEGSELNLSVTENRAKQFNKNSLTDLKYPTKWISKGKNEDTGRIYKHLGYNHDAALAKLYNGVCNSWTEPLSEIDTNRPFHKKEKEVKKRQTNLKFAVKRSHANQPVRKINPRSFSHQKPAMSDGQSKEQSSGSDNSKNFPATRQTVIKSTMNGNVIYARALIKPINEPPMTVLDLKESLSRKNLKKCRSGGYAVESINVNTNVLGSSYYEGLVTAKEPSIECQDLDSSGKKEKRMFDEIEETIKLEELGSDLDSEGDFEMEEPDGVPRRVRFTISEAELQRRIKKLNDKKKRALDQPSSNLCLPDNHGEVSLKVKTDKRDYSKFDDERKCEENCFQFKDAEKVSKKRPEIELDLTLDDSQPLKGAVSLSKYIPAGSIEPYVIDPSNSLVIEGPPSSEVRKDFKSAFDDFMQITPEDDYAACIKSIIQADKYQLLLYQCSVCHKDYSSARILENHMEKDHVVHFRNSKCIMKCSVCKARFTNHKALILHAAYHKIQRVFPCSFCDSVFNQPYVTKCHEINVHQDIHRYFCRSCHKKYETRKDLDKHFKIHDSKRMYECHTCHKLLFTKQQWTRHVKIQHRSEIKVECPIQNCQDVFRNRDDYYLHIIRHNQESKYRKISLSVSEESRYHMECPACGCSKHVDEKYSYIVEKD